MLTSVMTPAVMVVARRLKPRQPVPGRPADLGLAEAAAEEHHTVSIGSMQVTLFTNKAHAG